MAATAKKRGPIDSLMGRPCIRCLGTYPQDLRNKIKAYRALNQGWGAISILVELEEEHDYSKSELPSVNSVHRFLRQEGFINPREPSEPLLATDCKKARHVHELWEMDAQGATQVFGIGYQSMINIKDSLSKKYCMAFPVGVKNQSSQPSTVHYKWALRLAFIESGLPQTIQVDKDSVFMENSSKSPFPSRIHLWLVGLGIELCFIDRPPPAKNATVERAHQTLEGQVIKGKHYECWSEFFGNCNKRRNRLNEKYPSRSLNKQAPLQAFPQAVHSGRPYSIPKEHRLFNLNRIYTFLAKGKWHRKVSSNKGVHLGGQRYHVKNASPKTTVNITFCEHTKQLIFRHVNELELARHPLKNFSKENLIGGQTKNLNSMYKQLFKSKDFPLAKNI